MLTSLFSFFCLRVQLLVIFVSSSSRISSSTPLFHSERGYFIHLLLYITKWAKGIVGVADGHIVAETERRSESAAAEITSPTNTRATSATTRVSGMFCTPFSTIRSHIMNITYLISSSSCIQLA